MQLNDGRILLCGSNHYTAVLAIHTAEMVLIREVQDMHSTSLRGARGSTVFSFGIYWSGFHTTNKDDEQLSQKEHDISKRKDSVEDLLLLSNGKLVVRDAYNIHVVGYQESNTMHNVLLSIDAESVTFMQEIDQDHILFTSGNVLTVLNTTSGDTTQYKIPGECVCLVFDL
jgi:hypothetical protein